MACLKKKMNDLKNRHLVSYIMLVLNILEIKHTSNTVHLTIAISKTAKLVPWILKGKIVNV